MKKLEHGQGMKVTILEGEGGRGRHKGSWVFLDRGKAVLKDRGSSPKNCVPMLSSLTTNIFVCLRRLRNGCPGGVAGLRKASGKETHIKMSNLKHTYDKANVG